MGNYIVFCKRNSDGKIHCDDGHAVEYINGHREWWSENELHRLDGPAVIYADGTMDWRVRNQSYQFPVEFQKVTGMSDEDIAVLILKYGR